MTEAAPPLGREIRDSIHGALRLARDAPGTMGLFNLSVTGFWRSFLAPVLIYPAFVVISICERATIPAPRPALGLHLAWESVAYAGQSVLFPILMIFLVRLLGLSATYVPFVITYNWSAVWITAILLPPVLLSVVPFAAEIGALLSMFASIAAAYYRWVVTRISLATTPLTALGLVVIEVLLSIGIVLAVRQIYDPPVSAGAVEIRPAD